MEIAKTELTLELERKIWGETIKQGVFGCFEVTIGWWGKERVDYMTYDTKGIWRCYEIKVSKSDFHSKAKTTFIGHYNYYVMPSELYEEVKDEIPRHIGVYCMSSLVKRPKKQELGVDEQILKDSIIRSLSRENEKFIKTGDNMYLNRLRSKITNLEKEVRDCRSRNIELNHSFYEVCNKFNLDHEEVRKIARNQ